MGKATSLREMTVLVAPRRLQVQGEHVLLGSPFDFVRRVSEVGYGDYYRGF